MLTSRVSYTGEMTRDVILARKEVKKHMATIDGWLTNYECVNSLKGVQDVIQLAHLVQGYTGAGLVTDEFGFLRFKTIEEVGLSEMDNVGYLPNDIYTNVISVADWKPLKVYVESKL